MKQSFALIDANNFYYSSEALFDPMLRGRACVILSNNDGCVVARSPEAKALGIKNGTPWFKLEPEAKARGWNLVGKSSNYELYGDLSARLMEVIGRFTWSQEVYSIDESFIAVTGAPHELLKQAREIKDAVERNTGLPVCVGVASTKTLAKFANRLAKQNPWMGGVCPLDLMDEEVLADIMGQVPVTGLWGVAGRTGAKLEKMGINTVADLKAADPTMIRKRFSVVMQRTVLELNGTPCNMLALHAQAKQQIIFSRSFAEPITTWDQMRQVLSVYAQKAALRLVGDGQHARILSVFAGTSHFGTNEPSFPAASIKLPGPTSDPVVLTRVAVQALENLFVPGSRYARAGIMLTGLEPAGAQPRFDPFVSAHEQRGIGTLLGEVQHKFGAAAIGLGHGGIQNPASWTMKRERMSPHYTTHWADLPVVMA